MKILLVNPAGGGSIWSLDGVPGFYGAPALMPNAALTTLAALTPAGRGLRLEVCDEALGEVGWEQPCDLAAVTGMTVDATRVEELCRGFRARGVPVALGGPYATLETERCRGLADHHFIGEAELTWPAFLDDWAAGEARPVYAQEEHIDLTRSPAPDWSLWDPADYLQAGVQTSRGCPHRCDFCDVVQYVGHRYRTKSVEQVMAEVRAAHAHGFGGITLSDDNYVGNPRRARELTRALGEWNRAQERPLSFSTQATMQVGDDEELLRLMADARFRFLFLGLETLREEGLRQVNKSQNLARDPAARLERIIAHGLVPFLGVIVGFDADDAAVFGELERFIARTAAPIVASSLLNAPPGTPLHQRMEEQGRLAGGDFSGEWQLAGNMRYRNFEAAELVRLNLEFLDRVYAPAAFGERLMTWAERVEYLPDEGEPDPDRIIEFMGRTGELLEFARANFTPAALHMFRASLKRTLRERPHLLPAVIDILGQYWHFHAYVRRVHGSQ